MADGAHALPAGTEQEARSYAGWGQTETKGVIKDLIDTEGVIQYIDMTLQGYTINPMTQKWEQVVKPQTSDDLRFILVNQVRAHINRITNFSKIDDYMIEIVCMDLHQAVVDILFFNSEGIRCNGSATESDLWARADNILYLIMNMVWISLHQGHNAGQRAMLEKIGGYTESMTKLPEQGRKKILGVI